MPSVIMGAYVSSHGGSMAADKPYVVVIGGANIDIAGRATAGLVPYDSNLGTVRLSHGGVGRNIAHNLALLGTDVQLIAPFGSDALADELTRGCLEARIGIEHAFLVPGAASSTYLFVMDAAGEMQLAINDMDIIKHLTIERLRERLDLIDAAAVCVIDANLEPSVLDWVAGNVHVPLFSDPISCAKAPRLANVIGRLHSFKPNRFEAQELTGTDDMDEAAEKLLATGLTRAFISLGRKGVLCAEGDARLFIERRPFGEVVNATGAGDSMMAALVWAHLNGMGLREAACAGLAAASIAIESPETVSPQMSEELLRTRMEGYLL